jgi:tRNA G18 (ribose-2'-O)-methylase SpoU
MFHVQRIDSLERPDLAPYRTMRREEDHKRQRIFVAEGDKVVRRMLASELEVVSVLLPEKWLAEFEPRLQRRREDIPVFVADKKLLENLTGFSMYQGVLGVGRLPAPVTVDQVLRRSPKPRLFAAIEGMTNAENVGVIVRNCAAFGVQALIVGETSSSPYLRRAVRSSMGTVFELPVVEGPCLVEALEELRHQHVRCYAAHPRAEQKPLSQADLRADACLVFGSEGYGLSTGVLEVCDEAVAVPMHGTVDSLNVGSATAVCLYEARRQRGGG